MSKYKEFITKNIDVVIILVLFGLFHVFMRPDYWDDARVGEDLIRYNMDLGALLKDIWLYATSCILIRIPMVYVTYWPHAIWKVLDTLIVVVWYFTMTRTIITVLENKNSSLVVGTKEKLFMMLSFMMFPYCFFASAGWMVTTVVYCWSLMAFAVAVYLLVRQRTVTRVRWYTYLIFGLMVLYAGNNYFLVFGLVAVILELYFFSKERRKLRWMTVEAMILSVINVINLVICPGNRVRNQTDAMYHDMADTLDASFLDHFRMGVNTAFYNMLSIPNAVLVLLGIVLVIMAIKPKMASSDALLGGKAKKNRLTLLASVGALIIDIGWNLYIFVRYNLSQGKLGYVYPDLSFETCPKMEQLVAVLSALLMVLLICLAVWNCGNIGERIILLSLILIVGLMPLMALGFTATVSVSIFRVISFFYYALIIVAGYFVLREGLLNNKLVSVLLYGVAGCGTLISVVQLFRHIVVYG